MGSLAAFQVLKYISKASIVQTGYQGGNRTHLGTNKNPGPKSAFFGISGPGKYQISAATKTLRGFLAIVHSTGEE
jgi:hypothetical protein